MVFGVCGQVGSLLVQRRPAKHATSFMSTQVLHGLGRTMVSCVAYL